MLRNVIPFFFFSLLALAGCGTNGRGGPGEAETPAVPRPYTPCCGARSAPGSLSDTGLPAEGPGPFRFVKIQKTYQDTERSRSILTDVFLPSEDGLSPSDSGGPYPLVVVVHGFSGSKDLMTSYGEGLATWGYVALVPTLWLITTSFKHEVAYLAYPPRLIPSDWTLNGYQVLFQRNQLGHFLQIP